MGSGELDVTLVVTLPPPVVTEFFRSPSPSPDARGSSLVRIALELVVSWTYTILTAPPQESLRIALFVLNQRRRTTRSDQAQPTSYVIEVFVVKSCDPRSMGTSPVPQATWDSGLRAGCTKAFPQLQPGTGK